MNFGWCLSGGFGAVVWIILEKPPHQTLHLNTSQSSFVTLLFLGGNDMNEQSYLTHTITSLRAVYERLTANITEKDANYKDLQQYMIDYKAELDKFEVYDYQQTLSMIDKQCFRQVM